MVRGGRGRGLIAIDQALGGPVARQGGAPIVPVPRPRLRSGVRCGFSGPPSARVSPRQARRRGASPNALERGVPTTAATSIEHSDRNRYASPRAPPRPDLFRPDTSLGASPETPSSPSPVYIESGGPRFAFGSSVRATRIQARPPTSWPAGGLPADAPPRAAPSGRRAASSYAVRSLPRTPGSRRPPRVVRRSPPFAAAGRFVDTRAGNRP